MHLVRPRLPGFTPSQSLNPPPNSSTLPPGEWLLLPKQAGDTGWIPGLERSSGEGTGYPLQYSWASLVAQMAKNLPAMWKTWVQSMGWEDPLEKGMATQSCILAWRIPWTTVHGSQRVGHD